MSIQATSLTKNLTTRILPKKSIVWIVLGGILSSIATGFIENPPEASITGAKYHGYPRVWRITHVPQTFQPIKYLLSELLIDIIFWSVVVLIVFILLGKVIEQFGDNKRGH